MRRVEEGLQDCEVSGDFGPRFVELARSEKVNQEMVPFLNRLSTYLFNLAREANLRAGQADEAWKL